VILLLASSNLKGTDLKDCVKHVGMPLFDMLLGICCISLYVWARLLV